ncbi:MAG TPA: DUF2066 domain-containing protein [Stellaceae bacterium]|nr:DUF2066 domain-containing protein [Stellaceae bacterium]
MTLPQVSASAAGHTGRRIAGACLLLLMMTLAFAAARADDQQDPYSATVKVDATADSAAAARTIARTDGQRRALDDVIVQLSGSTDLSKLPKLDDGTITDMVASFEVANEKMSTVRYLADYTFHFRPAKIRALMRSADIAMAAPPSKPVVVVPVYRDGDQVVLWDDPNPWRDAWGRVAAPSGPTKLAVPMGGVGDLTAIDAEQARAGDPQALSEIAQRNDAEGALVAVATTRRDGDRLAGLDITIKRYHAGQPADSRSESIDTHPGESDSDFFTRAVEQVVADIEHGGPPAADKAVDKVASLDATIPISSLGDWIELRRRLAAVPGIHAVDLLSLSRHEAKVVIRFVGDPEKLKVNLAEADLDLGGADPDWRLVPAGAAGPN